MQRRSSQGRHLIELRLRFSSKVLEAATSAADSS